MLLLLLLPLLPLLLPPPPLLLLPFCFAAAALLVCCCCWLRAPAQNLPASTFRPPPSPQVESPDVSKLVAELLQRSQEADVNQSNPHSFRTSVPLVFALFGVGAFGDKSNLVWVSALHWDQLPGVTGDDFLETAFPW